MRAAGPKRQERKMIFEVYFPTECVYYSRLRNALLAAGGVGKRISVIARSAIRAAGTPVIS